MRRTLELLLPALIPSWDFFRSVEASPRIEYWVAEDGPYWREFQPRPAQITAGAMVRRLFWNPNWNDQLFLVSCAERLVTDPTEHAVDAIRNRLETALMPKKGRRTVQFRLVFVSEAQGHTVREVEYESTPFLLRAS